MRSTKLAFALFLLASVAVDAKPSPKNRLVDSSPVVPFLGSSSSTSSGGAPTRPGVASTPSSSSAAPSPRITSSSTSRPPPTTTSRSTTTAVASVPSSSLPHTTSAVSASSLPPVSPLAGCAATPTAAPYNTLPTCPGGCTWPALDQPPPVAASWLTLFDMTKIPPAPPNGVDANGDVSNSNGYTTTSDPFCTWTFTQCTRAQTDVMVCPSSNVWGITYDDGPQPPSPILHQYLASVNQRATMFIIGSRALEYSNVLLEAYQAGHQIAVHTWSHPYLTTQSNETIIAEIKWTEMVIKAITGVTPRYFRAPHGDLDDRVRYIVTALGYKIIQWNHDTEDWMLSSPSVYHMEPSWVDGNMTLWAQQDKNGAQGMITLEHELSLDSVCEAQKSYVVMRNAGWTPMPIADCLGDTQYYVEGGAPTNSTASQSSSPSGGNGTTNSNSTSSTTNPSSAASISSPMASWVVGLLSALAAVGAMGL